MKKILALVLALVMVLALFAGCSSSSDSSAADDGEAAAAEGTETEETAEEADEGAEEETEPADLVTIRVGASPTPHAEILAVIKDALAEQGYDLEIIEYTDYVQPNLAVDDGEIEANYFQHIAYLDWFNEEYDTDLVSVAAIHYEPFGLYTGKTASIDELADGAEIIIPNDGSNETRALLLLQQEGLITLADGVDAAADITVYDIADNPKNLKITEMEAAQLANSLQDVDMAVINGNYAIQAGLSVSSDAIAVEDASGDAAQTYANVLVVKAGNENDEAVQALAAALQSDAVREYIEQTYADGSVVPIF